MTLTADSEDFTLSCDGFNFLDEDDITGNTLRVGEQGDIPTATVYFDDLSTAMLTLSQYAIGDDSATISVDEVHNLVANATEALPAIALGEGCSMSDGASLVPIELWQEMVPGIYQPEVAGSMAPSFVVSVPTDIGLECEDSFAQLASSPPASVVQFAIEDLPSVSWTDWSQPVTISWATTEPALDCEVAGSNFGGPVPGEDEGGGVQWSATITPTDDVDDLVVTCNAAGGLTAAVEAEVNVRATITQWDVTTLSSGEDGCANGNGCIALTWDTREGGPGDSCDLYVNGDPLGVANDGMNIVYDVNTGGDNMAFSKTFDLVCVGETADGEDVSPPGQFATQVYFGDITSDGQAGIAGTQFVTGGVGLTAGSNASVLSQLVEVESGFLVNGTDNLALSFPELTLVGGDFTISGNTSLTAMDFSALGSIGGDFTFSDSAFDSATVPGFLARWAPSIDLGTANPPDAMNTLVNINTNPQLNCADITGLSARMSFPANNCASVLAIANQDPCTLTCP